MKNHFIKPQSIPTIFLAVLAACCGLLWGCSNPPPEQQQLLPSPLKIQLSAPALISTTDLSPGLAVIYLDKFYRKLAQMPNLPEATSKGRSGRPIPLLNHQFGKDGLVFDSGEKTGIGMVMTGYLHLAKPGEYCFQALSNDGIELVLDQKLLFEDPTVHKDRLSPIGIADVDSGGWYPLTLRYFQRKGTATLKLYWKPPGAMEFSIVPKKIYAHK
jgi:hypothetical protein